MAGCMQERGFSSHNSYRLSKMAEVLSTVTCLAKPDSYTGGGFSSHNSYSLNKPAMALSTVTCLDQPD